MGIAKGISFRKEENPWEKRNGRKKKDLENMSEMAFLIISRDKPMGLRYEQYSKKMKQIGFFSYFREWLWLAWSNFLSRVINLSILCQTRFKTSMYNERGTWRKSTSVEKLWSIRLVVTSALAALHSLKDYPQNEKKIVQSSHLLVSPWAKNILITCNF